MATRNIVPRANAEGSIGTAAKQWAEAYIQALYTDSFEADTITLEGDTPKIRLNGTEGSGLDLSVREYQGNIEIYAEVAAQVRTRWSGLNGTRLFPLIVAAELASDCVITSKILNSNVTTAKILDANVTYAKIQDVAGLSVVGRAGNTSGVTAAITAASDGQVLRRDGTSIGFGTVVSAGIADDAIETAKIMHAAVTPPKIYNKSVTALTTTTPTLTAAQVVGGLFTYNNGSAGSLTLPSASALVTELGSDCQVGTWIEMIVVTITGAGIPTLVNTDFTVVGSLVGQATNFAGRWLILVTNVGTPACTIYRAVSA
jgi:hypothetical protein